MNFDYLYKNFPNIEDIMFSTNAVAHIDKILDAIEIVDNTVTKPCSFNIQFSVDGEKYTKENRGIDLSIITKNIETLILELNQKKLQFVKVILHLHNVVGHNIFSSLKSQEEIDAYWIELNTLNNYFCKLNDNKKVIFTPICSPAIEQPIQATKEDGVNLANFIFKSLQGPGRTNTLTIIAKIKQVYAYLLNHNSNYKKLIDFLTTFDYSNNEQLQCYNAIRSNSTCGPQSGVLKMGYDGTLYFCQNVMFQTKKEDLKLETNFSDNYFYELIKHNRYPNIFTATDEELKDYFELYHTYVNGALGIKFVNALNLLYELADAKQCDANYLYNKDKLIRDAFISVFIQNCPHADTVETGSMYGRSIDLMRLYGNGVFDIYSSYAFIEEGEKQ